MTFMSSFPLFLIFKNFSCPKISSKFARHLVASQTIPGFRYGPTESEKKKILVKQKHLKVENIRKELKNITKRVCHSLFVILSDETISSWQKLKLSSKYEHHEKSTFSKIKKLHKIEKKYSKNSFF